MEQNFVIRVSPEKLKEQAVLVADYVDAIAKDFDGIRQIVKTSGIYWQGEASKRHCQIFEENEADISQILKRLGEHPVDLQKMAGLYEQAEEQNEIMAGSLPENVF